MLHNDHRVTQFHWPIELSHPSLNIRRMQSGGRFVENIQCVSALVALQLRRQFDGLRFASDSSVAGCPRRKYS